MRTTIRLDDALLVQAKRYAADSQQTLTALIEELLRERLGKRSNRRKRRPVNLTTAGGNGLRPGVDLDNAADLLDVMHDSV